MNWSILCRNPLFGKVGDPHVTQVLIWKRSHPRLLFLFKCLSPKCARRYRRGQVLMPEASAAKTKPSLVVGQREVWCGQDTHCWAQISKRCRAPLKSNHLLFLSLRLGLQLTLLWWHHLYFASGEGPCLLYTSQPPNTFVTWNQHPRAGSYLKCHQPACYSALSRHF